MVSFSCEVCNDTVMKKKLQQHQRSCRGAYFTCIDCSTTFYGNDHQGHTSCISESEKYEGSLYKGKKKNQNQNQQQQQKQQKQQPPKQEVKETKPEAKKEVKKEVKKETKKEEFNLGKYIESEPTSLYKIFKSAKKDNKKLAEKSDFLKNVKISKNTDGSFSLSI